ncbi:unnamed protein product, partial [Brassica oleracea var. botrytis]
WWKRIRSAVSLRFPFQSKGRASSSPSLHPLSAPANKAGTSAASASTREISQILSPSVSLFASGSIVFVYFQSLSLYFKMLLYNKQKKNAKGNRILISVTVLGSAGPIRFVAYEDDLVASVIDTALKCYAREGRNGARKGGSFKAWINKSFSLKVSTH